jgi:hypothetical protein
MSKWKFCAESPSFIVEITGGSVRILDKPSGNLIKTFKGYTYLYTGGIRPDETEFFALENGKHFYVYSLRDFELIKRVTLPRTYESIDVCGFYSDDGEILFIPAERYVYDDPDTYQGHYEYVLCQYETTHYTLVKKWVMPEQMYLWQDIKTWLTEKGF